jgi:hypothetical protein
MSLPKIKRKINLKRQSCNHFLLFVNKNVFFRIKFHAETIMVVNIFEMR